MARPAAADDDRARDGRAQRRLLPLHAPEDEDGPFVFYGEFREVDPPRLLVQTFDFEGNDLGPSLDRVEFEQVGAEQTRLVVTATFDSVEARDSMLQSGMEKGVNEGYEKLDELLARRAHLQLITLPPVSMRTYVPIRSEETMPQFDAYEDLVGKWRWRLLGADGRTLPPPASRSIRIGTP